MQTHLGRATSWAFLFKGATTTPSSVLQDAMGRCDGEMRRQDEPTLDCHRVVLGLIGGGICEIKK